jgi:hypothetical protein
MSDLLLVAPGSTGSAAGDGQLTEAQVLLKPMVLDSVTVNHTLGRAVKADDTRSGFGQDPMSSAPL